MDKFNKKVLVGALMAASLGMASSANAYLISPTGSGLDIIDVQLLDWAPGNAYSACMSGVCATNNNVGEIDLDDTILALAHAEISVFQTTSNVNFNPFTATGVKTAEWTFVTGFEETVSGLGVLAGNSAISADFQTTGTGINFFEIYYDAAAATFADALKGAETYNQGTLILSGTVKAFDPISGAGGTTFTTTADGGAPDGAGGAVGNLALDQFGVNGYTALSSVAGNGGGDIDITIGFINTSFFRGGDITNLDINFDTQQNLAFDKVDPSSCFWDGVILVEGAGNGYGTCSTDGTGTTGSLVSGPDIAALDIDGDGLAGLAGGAINGNSFGGPALNKDKTVIVFQTDASSNLPSAPIPTPGSLALMGLGLLLIGRMRGKRSV